MAMVDLKSTPQDSSCTPQPEKDLMNSRDANVPATDEQNQEAAIAKVSTAPRITLDKRDAEIKEKTFHVFPDTMLTICVITLKNGFTVTGESACASKANFNKQIGEEIAERNAKDKIWAFLGYELKTKLARIEAAPAVQQKMALLFPEAKTYVGTKVVHGTPMTLGAYNDFRGWIIPVNEDPNAEGYLVEYVDGGKPNIAGFYGYVSWSPRDVFEVAYSVGFEPRKETFIDRMIKESQQLTEKVQKLEEFIGGKMYLELPLDEREDQREQLQGMRNYLWYVNKRLKRQGVAMVSE